MKLFKKSERNLKISNMIKAFKACGDTVRNIGTWCKWKDLQDMGQLQVKMTVYEVKVDGMTVYMIGDSLDRVAAPIIENKKEIMDWLADHGYKTEKRWYIEDYGMSESDWNYWNGLEER